MSKIDFSRVMKSVQTTVVKHSPEILTGLGIAGMVSSTVLAVRATPKALILIEDEKRRQNNENMDRAEAEGQEVCQHVDKLKLWEVVKTTWKCYIPSTVTCAMSIACLIGASSVNARRNAALATAYTLSENALKEYQEKVVETIGEKKEQAVRDAIAKDRIEKDPVSTKEVIITEKGNTLCYDAISGRYFKSDIDKLRKAENYLNRQMMNDLYISLNDFYDEVGLPHTRTGNDLGWKLDRGFLELRFSSQLAEDGTPCLVVDYNIAPEYDYSRLM